MFRALWRSLPAVVLAGAGALAGWRVLAPAEVLDQATAPYPAPAARAPGVTGRTNAAPLIVDDRIRVYAAKRQVRADGPVDGKTVYTALWSFRRWPQQVAGVVAIGPTVISRWSDGELVAIDGRTGTIAWRARGPSAPGFAGHRTGASTVWGPAGLHVAGGTVVVTGGGRLAAYEGSTGARRWTAAVPAGCTDGFTTSGGRYVCPTRAYDVATGTPVPGPPGPLTPLGCEVAASSCAGFRDGTGRGWLAGDATPRPLTALDRPGSTVVAGLVAAPGTGGSLEITDPGSGRVVGRFPAGAQVLGASAAGRLVLLGADRTLQLIDPRTGATEASFPLAVEREKLTWTPGRWQVTDSYAAIERLTTGGPADPDAPDYYFTVQTVIIAAV